jgi:hypothetical protein
VEPGEAGEEGGETVVGGIVVAFAAGVIAGRWVWGRWIPALRAYLYARWVRAVRAAVATLPPGEREALLLPHRIASHVEWDDVVREEEIAAGGGQ